MPYPVNLTVCSVKNRILLSVCLKNRYQTGIPEVPKTREDFEQAINVVLGNREEVKNQAEQKFSAFLNHVENLNFEVDDDLLTNWYMEQKEKLEDKLSMTNELAQLGISVKLLTMSSMCCMPRWHNLSIS